MKLSIVMPVYNEVAYIERVHVGFGD